MDDPAACIQNRDHAGNERGPLKTPHGSRFHRDDVRRARDPFSRAPGPRSFDPRLSVGMVVRRALYISIRGSTSGRRFTGVLGAVVLSALSGGRGPGMLATRLASWTSIKLSWPPTTRSKGISTSLFLIAFLAVARLNQFPATPTTRPKNLPRCPRRTDQRVRAKKQRNEAQTGAVS